MYLLISAAVVLEAVSITIRSLCCAGRKAAMTDLAQRTGRVLVSRRVGAGWRRGWRGRTDHTGLNRLGTLTMRIFCTIGGKRPPHASSTGERYLRPKGARARVGRGTGKDAGGVRVAVAEAQDVAS